jgi:hypothetical protein
MKKIIAMGVVVIVLFGLSAGASWMLNHNGLQETKTEEGQEAEGGKAHKNTAPVGTGHETPTNLRPGFNADSDAAGQLLVAVKSEKEALKTREKQLATRQKSLDLILLDIRTERGVIDELRKQLDEELKTASEKMDAIERRSGDVSKQSKQTQAKALEVDDRWSKFADSEKDNYKHIAQVYENMEAEAAAESLQKMADNGKMDIAAKVLTQMSERKAARLLTALPDKALAAQLAESMLKIVNVAPPIAKK